jgi:DNA-binding NarL/FixJ family response regulator
MNRPRLLIADDHRLFAHALSHLLGESFQILDTAGDGRALLQKAVQLQPDLVIVDMEMPLLNGIDAARQLKGSLCGGRLIFLSMHGDDSLVMQAFQAGAAAYVLKTSPAEEILRAIRDVLDGRIHVDPQLPAELRELILRGRLKSGVRYSGGLTGREREVVQLIAEGHSIKEIGYLLHLTCKTVEFHKYNAMKKSHARSTADLTRYAVRSGLAGL